MKYIKSILTFAGVLFLSISCDNNTNTHNLIPIHIDPDKVEKAYDIVGDVEDEWEIVPLETNDECRISQISRIIFQNGQYYILDNLSIISVFDSTGKFLRKLDKNGGVFDVIANEVWVYSADKQRLMVYDSLLNYLDETGKSEITAFDIKHVGQYIYMATNWVGVQPRSCQLSKYSIPDKKFDCMLKVEKPNTDVVFNKNKHLVKYGDSCMFFQSYCDTLFQIRDGIVAPKYKFSFSKRYKDIPLNMEQAQQQDNETIRGLMDLNRTQNSIIFTYIDRKKLALAVYSELTGECQVYSQFLHSDLGNLRMLLIQFTPNSEIICTFQSDWLTDKYRGFVDDTKFKNSADMDKLKSRIAGLKQNDNPVLVKFKLKKDSKL